MKLLNFTKIIIILHLLLLTSCTTPLLSEQECLNTNWQQIGLKDGQTGDQALDLSEHIKACKFYNINIENNGYKIGYKEGLVQYCSKNRVEKLAARGEDYPMVCDNDVFAEIKKHWLTSLKKYCTPNLGKLYGQKGEATPLVCGNGTFGQMEKSWQLGINQYCNYKQGLNAGQNGEVPNVYCEIQKHQAYFTGIDKGFTYFCVPEKAYQLGRYGKTVAIKCPANLAVNFDIAYNKGYRIYNYIVEINNKINSLGQMISKNEHKIIKIDRKIIDLNEEIISTQRNLDSRDCYFETKSNKCTKKRDQEIISIKIDNLSIRGLQRDRVNYQNYIHYLKIVKLGYESEIRMLELKENLT